MNLNFDEVKERDVEFKLFEKRSNIHHSRAGWDLFLEIETLSPDDFISSLYSLLSYKKMNSDEYDDPLMIFREEAQEMMCKNDLDDETSLKYKLILLTDSLNINFLIMILSFYFKNPYLLNNKYSRYHHR